MNVVKQITSKYLKARLFKYLMANKEEAKIMRKAENYYISKQFARFQDGLKHKQQ